MECDSSVLILSHEAGGGTEVFLQNYLHNNKTDKAIVLRPSQVPHDMVEWKVLLKNKNIKRIVVNHLLGFPLYKTMELLQQLAVPYDVFLHDYFCICPNTSLDCQALHCHEFRLNDYCRYIFKARDMELIDLSEYRRRFHLFLLGAANVIAPTHYAAGIINELYQDVHIAVQPHKLHGNIMRSFSNDFVNKPIITMAFLGTFCAQKGARYILQLNAWIKKKSMPVRLVVIGEDMFDVAGDRTGIVFTGAYKQERVAQLLAINKAAVVLIPSAFPETYCYTASEAILAGFPVLTVNWGAQAMRVQKADCGWVIDRYMPDRGLEGMQRLVSYLTTPSGRLEILTKAANTLNFQNGME